MDKAIEKALLTWYPVDHPLHNDPRHPAIKLAGEAGELLDLYGKHCYKPGFDWWNCKLCKQSKDNHTLFPGHNRLSCDIDYEPQQPFQYYIPLVLDELGDLWYYLRILSYIYECELDYYSFYSMGNGNILKSLSSVNISAARILQRVIDNEVDSMNDRIIFILTNFIDILKHLDTTLDELTELNYLKLNSEPTNHGWHNAGIK